MSTTSPELASQSNPHAVAKDIVTNGDVFRGPLASCKAGFSDTGEMLRTTSPRFDGHMIVSASHVIEFHPNLPTGINLDDIQIGSVGASANRHVGNMYIPTLDEMKTPQGSIAKGHVLNQFDIRGSIHRPHPNSFP
jgi:hypothetical protein